jgi:phosphatidylserine synthase
MPIPVAAGLLASIVHFAPNPLSIYGDDSGRLYSTLLMGLIAVLSFLMVSKLRYTSMKTVGTGRGNLYIVLVIAAVGMLVWLYSNYVLLILSALYVGHGVVWYLFGLLRPRPAKVDAEA